MIGGFAAVVRGSPLPTEDVDIVPRRTTSNLTRLAAALASINAKLRTATGPVDAPLDTRFLESMPFMLNLTTDHGDLDLTFEPAGPRGGYEGWDSDADDVRIGVGLVVRVASLDAIIESKTAAGRPKDERSLPYLESLRERLRHE